MLAASTFPLTTSFTRRDCLFLGLLTTVGLLVGLRGIYHYGYMGQDFPAHWALILLFPYEPWAFIYNRTNPPGLYWLGSFIHGHVSAAHFLEFTSLAFLLLNLAGLWLLYRFLWQMMARGTLRYCAAALVTLIPFRVIQSVVIAADAFSLPIFALVALFALALFGDPRRFGCWFGLSVSLSAGMFCKYTFVGLLPPLLLLLGVAIGRRLGKGERFRWAVIGSLALTFPSELFVLQMHESTQLKGTLTDQVWLAPGQAPVMRWRDILLLKENDRSLLTAPGYFRGRIFEVRKFSYPGLVHLSAFTDILDLFQPVSAEVPTDWAHRTQKPFPRVRTPFSGTLQTWSVRWCVGFSLLAILGTLACGAVSLASLAAPRPLLPDTTVVLCALAVGFYCPIFLTLTRVNDPYMAAYWHPRLVLPSLLVFFSLGFVLIDLAQRKFARLRPLVPAVAVYTLGACLLFVGFLG